MSGDSGEAHRFITGPEINIAASKLLAKGGLCMSTTAEEKTTTHKNKKWFAAGGAILILLFCLFFFRVEKVSIEGNTYYSQEEMADMFQKNVLEKNLLGFWLLDRLSLTPNLPFVREYEVSYPSPNEVHIKLYEKTIVAGISYSGQYIYFEKDGMVLKSMEEPLEGIPLFETKSLTTFSLYATVEMENENQLRQIMNLSQLFQHYGITWDKVEFTEKDEAVLYSGDIKVTLGKSDNYDERISALSSILEQLLKEKKKGVLDMSNYKVKGTVILEQPEEKKKK